MSEFPKIPQTSTSGIYNNNPTNITRFNRHIVMKQNAVASATRKFIYHKNKQSQSNAPRKMINESFQNSTQQSSTNSAFGDNRIHHHRSNNKNSNINRASRSNFRLNVGGNNNNNASFNLKQIKKNYESRIVSQPPQKNSNSFQEEEQAEQLSNQKLNQSLNSDAMIKSKIYQTQQLARKIYQREKSPQILKLLSPDNQDNRRMVSLSPQKLYDQKQPQVEQHPSVPMSLFKNKKFTPYSSANSKLLLKIYKNPPFQQRKYGNSNNLDISTNSATVSSGMTDQIRLISKNYPNLNDTYNDLGTSVQIGSIQQLHQTRKARSKSPSGFKPHSSSLSSSSKQNLLKSSSSKYILMPSQSRILPKLVDQSMRMGGSPDQQGSEILARKGSFINRGKKSNINNYSLDDRDGILFPDINLQKQENHIKSRKKSVSQSPLSYEDIHRRELRIYKSMAKQSYVAASRNLKKSPYMMNDVKVKKTIAQPYFLPSIYSTIQEEMIKQGEF